jgi:hypothetical protein
MKSAANIESAKAALSARLSGTIDSKGYTRSLQENLDPGMLLEQGK